MGSENDGRDQGRAFALYSQAGTCILVTSIYAVIGYIHALQVILRCPALAGKEYEIDKKLSHALSQCLYSRKEKV